MYSDYLTQPELSGTELSRLDPSRLPDLPQDWWESYAHYTPEMLREHFEVERELAQRLMSASRTERTRLYSQVYDELFERIPFHPQLRRKEAKVGARNRVPTSLKQYLSPESSFLEIGPGDCQVSFAVAGVVARVYAVDVSSVVSESAETPENFSLILSDGSSIDVPEGSIDVAFSDQLMEHLHPDDSVAQLRNIARAMRQGGRYICCTPHRYGGPADVSRFFRRKAEGFHLHEYTLAELYALVKEAGFRRVALLKRFGNEYHEIPIWIGLAVERLMALVPVSRRARLFRYAAPLIEIRLVATR